MAHNSHQDDDSVEVLHEEEVETDHELSDDDYDHDEIETEGAFPMRRSTKMLPRTRLM